MTNIPESMGRLLILPTQCHRLPGFLNDSCHPLCAIPCKPFIELLFQILYPDRVRSRGSAIKEMLYSCSSGDHGARQRGHWGDIFVIYTTPNSPQIVFEIVGSREGSGGKGGFVQMVRNIFLWEVACGRDLGRICLGP